MNSAEKIRRATVLVADALRVSRVVLLHGPRQCGKSTLGERVAKTCGMDYVTFDDSEQLAAAERDPATFLANFDKPVAIDEFQRAGSAFILAIKAAVDRKKDKGRYLLLGSTNFLTVPKLAESLTGRVRIVRMWPFSFGERFGGKDNFIDRALQGDAALLAAHRGATPERDLYVQYACEGGFPEATSLTERDRNHWFNDYIDTVIQREIAEAADIRRVHGLRKLAQYLAANSGGELVVSRIASDLGLDRATVESYVGWLETAFIVHRIPAWSRNLTSKVVRRPKVFVNDSGLAAAMMGKNLQFLRQLTEPKTGPVIETMVVNEFAKQLTWSDTVGELGHFRDADGREVDLVVEARDGRVLGVEIKSTSTPKLEHFRWLADLRERVDRTKGSFVVGVVFHTGKTRLSFGDRLVALPIGDLWT
jgi:uncharacterized protein